MGFLDDPRITGTTTVDLYGRYWVKLANCLPREKSEVAERLLTSATVFRQADQQERSSDTAAYRTYMVAASVVDWNLDDGEGDAARVWDLSSDAAKLRGVKRLPEMFFQKIWEAVDELNARPSESELAQFRDAGDVGDPARPAGSAVADEVRAGEAAVAGVGAAADGVLAAPVA